MIATDARARIARDSRRRLSLVALLLISVFLPGQGARLAGRTIEFQTSEVTFGSVDVSPNGQQIAFDLLGDIYVVSIRGGKARSIVSGPAFDSRPRWSPDGRSLAFISDRAGPEDLWILDVATGKVRPISRQPLSSPLPMASPAWSPDGKSIVAVTAEKIPSPTRNLSLSLRSFSLDGAAPAVLAPGIRASDPVFSPDGKSIYFARSVEPLDVIKWTNDDTVLTGWQIARLDRQSGRAVTLTGDVQGAMAPTLSPDGRWMAYVTRRAAQTQLRLRDLQLGKDKLLVPRIDRDQQESKLREGLAPSSSFTPDSKYLVSAIGGKLWRIDLHSGVRRQIPFTVDVKLELAEITRETAPPAYQDEIRVRHIGRPVVSPDGRHVAFEALRKIWIADRNGSAVRRLTGTDVGAETGPSWAPDGRSLVFSASDTSGAGHIYRQSLGTASAPARLTSAAGAYSNPLLDGDGRSLYFVWRALDEFLLYNGRGAGEIRSLDLASGRTRSWGAVPADVAVKPQRVRGSDRLYFFDPGAGLIEFTPDGEQRIVLNVHFRSDPPDSREEYSGGMRAHDLILAPSGRAAVVRRDWELYLVEFADGIAAYRDRSIPMLSPPPGVKVSRLTASGGLDPSWIDDRRVLFALGSKLFTVDASTKQTSGADIGLTVKSARPEGARLFRGGKILTMGKSGIIPSGDMLVVGNRIAAVGPSGSFAVPPGAAVIDARGTTLMPGFIDTHCHPPARPAGSPVLRQSWSLLNYLAYGVTTCFDPFGPLDELTDRYLIEAGESVGPRLFTVAGPIEWYNPLAAAEQAQETLARYSAYDLFAIKEYMSGPRSIRTNIADAARRHTLMSFFETSSFRHNIGNVLEGYSDMAHSFPSPDIHDDVKQLLMRTGTSVHVQFLTLRDEGGPSAIFHFLNKYDPLTDGKFLRFAPDALVKEKALRRFHVDDREQVFPAFARSIAGLADAGVAIGLGGHGEMLGLGYHWELEALASGSGQMKALQIGTIGGAKAIGMDRDIGSIEPGKLADFIVVEGDPLARIQDTKKLRFVIKNGVVYDPASLDQIEPERKTGPIPWFRNTAGSRNPDRR